MKQLLKTKYTVPEIPLSEYPRPQMQRDSYLCLNGFWRFTKTKAEQTEYAFDQTIKVPFSPETQASGIKDGFCLGVDEKLVYEREVEIPKEFLKEVTYLHFGGVDQVCEVFFNGVLVKKHIGGCTPFFADVSSVVKAGMNVIRVECVDGTEKTEYCRGKQSSFPGTIWYTSQSGIWQTVWMESLPKNHIQNLKITPCFEENSVTVGVQTDGKKKIRVFDGENEIFSGEFDGEQVKVDYPFEPWTPENPKLYDFTLESESGDTVRSYFGLRSFKIGTDKNGKKRLFLNGKPYFMNGVLDQGYWPEGLWTYPTDDAVFDELKMLKEMGFNTVRKHIKIEPMRFYHYCDKLGLIVWQDFVSGGGVYEWTHVALFPFLGFQHKDDDYKYFARENEGGREEFLSTMEETVSALYNVVSIGAWVPFNEGWGQFDSAKVCEKLLKKDSTRIVDSVSGWHDQGKGKTEIKSLHTYYTPLKVPKDERAVVLSEFGGYSMQTEGHVFNPEKEFGYKKFYTQEKLCAALEKLYLNKLKPLIKKGLSACIYTQVSDVEEEINGLVTYDRQVIKVPVEFMRSINEKIKKEADLIE